MKTGTVKSLFDHYNGTAPGFDALRLVLSVIILLWHTVYVCYGRYSEMYDLVWTHPVVQPVLRAILPMFFFLGGFLVTGSAYRVRKTSRFLMYRVLRIVPALLVEVSLSALLLGAVLTTLPLSAYFTHVDFYKYFLNIIGFVHFYLPGVFGDHPSNVVNINLWTLPPDFRSYAIMAVLMASGIAFNRKLLWAVCLLGHAFLLILMPLALNWGDSGTVFVKPFMLIYSFLLGVICYVFADRIPINKKFLWLSVLGLLFFEWGPTTLLGIWSACYLTLCIGFMNLEKFPLVKRGDYSYGVYLYGFPIKQALWHYIPAVREWWILFLVALPLTLIFSILSWHYIEKPFLGLKRFFKPKHDNIAAAMPDNKDVEQVVQSRPPETHGQSDTAKNEPA